MFKRVMKRKRRQEKEEELGLDSEMKEVLGLQDTDSEESDSSSGEEDSGSEDEKSGSDVDVGGSNEDSEDEEEEQEEDGEEEAADDLESLPESSSDEDEAELPPMTVTEAVRDPLYIISMDPEVKACILCPGKSLRNSTMSDIHRSSKAHNRRFARFVELVGKTGPEGDVRDLIKTMNAEAGIVPKATESKRAAKRKAKLLVMKAKREAHKKMASKKRKQAQKAGDKKKGGPATAVKSKPDGSKPPKKRRKVDDLAEDKQDAPVKSPSKDKGKDKETQPALPADSEPEARRPKAKATEDAASVKSQPDERTTPKTRAGTKAGFRAARPPRQKLGTKRKPTA